MLGKMILAALFVSGAVAAQDIPRFDPRPLPHHEYTGGWEHFVGGGVAAFDCNQDRLPELFMAGGASPAKLMINTTKGVGGPLQFEDSTPPELALTRVTGAYPLDIDADGILDLAILRVGPDMLMKGIGQCRFRPFGDELGFQSGDHWTTAFSATWEQGAALPTLAFGTYVNRADPDGPFEACDATLLYRPNGNRYAAPRSLEPGYCALSMLFTDWSRSGRQDLRVSNDRHYYVRGGQEQMWAMEAAPRLYTEAEGWKKYSLWGMGIASRDMNGDGFPDVVLTSMGDQHLQYFQPSDGGPSYAVAPFDRGTAAHRPYAGGDGRPSTGWHAAIGDVQNDGLDDIFISKGNVNQMPDAAMRDPNNLLVQQADGRFVETGELAGLASFARSRGAALVDLNLDGRLDLAVVNRRAPAELYENETDDGNWLLVQVEGDAPNVQAIGAFVELRSEGRTWSQEITVGGGHASGQAGFLHFGLGTAENAEIRLIWPDQTASEWQAVSVNTRLLLSRGRGVIALP